LEPLYDDILINTFTMAAAAAVYPPLDQRPVKNTVVLFDVDDTLTKPRQVGTLRERSTIA
jgi:hypothetical protein